MARHTRTVLANGTHTDHPIPDLPFVDDSHIPVHDGRAVEAVGRRHESGTWGRFDQCRGDGPAEQGWAAFTSDPLVTSLSWVVRWHPEHGRSVFLAESRPAINIQQDFVWDLKGSLLSRHGGYWWDGERWYRPAQIWDPTSESYVRRAVPGAVCVSAAQLLAPDQYDVGDPDAGRVLEITDVTPGAPYEGRWADDLARWARDRPKEALPLERCVVRMLAPEIDAAALVNAVQLAEMAGLAPSTLRAYIARGENDVPPATVHAPRPLWARAVAAEWIEQRSRSREKIAAVLSSRDGEEGAPSRGLQAVWDRWARAASSALWDTDHRRRWALRYRTRSQVDEVARDLAWTMAADLESVLPIGALLSTVEYAALYDCTTVAHALGKGSARQRAKDWEEWESFDFNPHVVDTLEWLIEHYPAEAAYAVANIVLAASQVQGIPAKVTQRSIRSSLGTGGASPSSTLDHDTRDAFLGKVFAPE